MTKGIPAVAIRRQKEAILKFETKLMKLAELLEERKFDSLPKRMEPTTFMAWEDKEVGVFKLSRNLLYKKDLDAYRILQAKLNKLLEDLAKARTSGSKKDEKNFKLLEKLKDAERRARTYMNDYSSVKAQLDEANKEVGRLQERLARLNLKVGKIASFEVAKRNIDSVD